MMNEPWWILDSMRGAIDCMTVMEEVIGKKVQLRWIMNPERENVNNEWRKPSVLKSTKKGCDVRMTHDWLRGSFICSREKNTMVPAAVSPPLWRWSLVIDSLKLKTNQWRVLCFCNFKWGSHLSWICDTNQYLPQKIFCSFIYLDSTKSNINDESSGTYCCFVVSTKECGWVL